MYLSLFFIRQILHEMWLHKLRSSLAIFCIAFGTFAIVALLALSDGFYKESYRSLMGIADGSCFIWQGRTTKSYHGYPQGRTINFKITDVVTLPKILKDIEAVTTEVSNSSTISHNGKNYTKNIYGVTQDHTLLYELALTTGSRFINQIDIEHNTRVAVLGNKVKTLLFGKQNGLELQFLINNVPFTVIGVLPDLKKYKYWDDMVFISYQSYLSLYGNQPIWEFVVLPRPGITPAQLEQTLRSYFAQKYHFDKTDKDAIGFWNSSEISQYLRWFLLALQLFLGGCGVMTLAVGCIGVANIMFLIITEKTYEIGLRKAIGATNKQIFFQLLLEALMIISIGGALGFGLAFFTITILQQITLPPWLGIPELSWTTAAITFAVLATIGLVAGFFPARKAATIDPIEALTK